MFQMGGFLGLLLERQVFSWGKDFVFIVELFLKGF